MTMTNKEITRRIYAIERMQALILSALSATMETLDDLYQNLPYGTVQAATLEEMRDAIAVAQEHAKPLEPLERR